MLRNVTGLTMLATSSLSAQSAISGTVKEDSTKAPVPGVEVIVEGKDQKWTSDAAGRFLMTGLAQGFHTVLIRSIGYQPIRLRAYVVANDTLYIDLRIKKAVVELAPLEVTATSVPPGLQPFEERRLKGLGKFVDWTVLRNSGHRKLSDVLREVPGIRIRNDPNTGIWYLAGAREGCPMQLYLNGIMIWKPGLGQPPLAVDSWNTTDLDAIEVYRGPAETPAMYEGNGGKCGTVLLWTRRQ